MEEMDEMAAHPPKTSLFGGGGHTAWDNVGCRRRRCCHRRMNLLTLRRGLQEAWLAVILRGHLACHPSPLQVDKPVGEAAKDAARDAKVMVGVQPSAQEDEGPPAAATP